VYYSYHFIFLHYDTTTTTTTTHTHYRSEKDVILREGVEQHGNKWKVIAELLNNAVNSRK
jgi:hypothetical protein